MPRKFVYFFIIVISLLTMLAIGVIDKHLSNEVVRGIVDFELAKSPERVQQIFDSWGHLGRVWAGFSLGIDYLFLLFYTMFFIFSAYKIANKNHQIIHKYVRFVVLIFLLAGFFDAIENYLLLNLLTQHNISSTNTLMAFYFSLSKFILLALGIIFLIAGFIAKKIQHQ